MKIDPTQQNQATALDSIRKKPSTKPTEESRQPQQVGSAFNVSLSSQALQAAAPNKVNEEAIRANVVAIRDQLASGTYNISGKDVATKILSLLGKSEG